MHKPLGLITTTTLARVVDRHLLRAVQHRADLSFWDGLGMVFPIRETPWKLFHLKLSMQPNWELPPLLLEWAKEPLLTFSGWIWDCWLQIFMEKVTLPTLLAEVWAHPLATLVAPRKSLLAICWLTWVMCAAELSPELPTEHRFPQTFQVALALNQESCSEPTAHSLLKTPCKCKHSVR